jgi:hypothetical protein
MNDFNDPHAPTPEFRASLKRELRRVYRAEEQFELEHPSAPRRARFGMKIVIAAAAVVTLCLGFVLGAATEYASAAGLEAQHRESAAMTADSRRQFAATRLDIARANYEAVRREFDAGIASRATLDAAQAEMDSMTANVARVEAAYGAGTVAGAAPRSGLSILKIPVRDALSALTCGTSTSSQTASAQQGIPVVNVTPVSARTTTTLGAVLGVREMSDGRVLVNDAGRRQIKVFDATLATATVALDSAGGTSNSYGPRASQIFPYLGDSTVITEIVSQDVLILDRNGQVARALATPQHEDGATPFPVRFPMPRGMDHKGRLVAQGGFRVRPEGVADSALVLRADLDTRQIETIGAYRGGGGRRRITQTPDGRRMITAIIQPVPIEDSWTVLSDGTVAFVRGKDYHVDWILPDGTKKSSEKLPFDWKRLSDDDKQRLMDSVRVIRDSLGAVRDARNAAAAYASAAGADSSAGGGVRGARGGGAGQGPPLVPTIQRYEFVPLSEIPDFYPPIRQNSAIPDRDGNVWILPTTSAQSQNGELVYDVVNPERGLFQRVRLPLGRSIAGFGKGGVIYLQVGDRANGFYLERVKITGTTPQK